MADDDAAALLRGLLESGDAIPIADRDLVVCRECGGPPHGHRPLCASLRWPVHVFDGDTAGDSRARQLAHWRYWTGGLRPLWIHHGEAADAPDHEVGEGLVPCRCRPEIIEPERRVGLG